MNRELKKGFTLVEILIVVAIIAILASAALVGLGPVQRSGRDTRRISDLRQVQNGTELYFAKCGHYPGFPENGTDCGSFDSISDWGDLTDSLTGSQLGISKVPDDPQGGKHYTYATNDTGSQYVLGAELENEGASQLRDDVDNDDLDGISGIDCDDPVYCIQL